MKMSIIRDAKLRHASGLVTEHEHAQTGAKDYGTYERKEAEPMHISPRMVYWREKQGRSGGLGYPGRTACGDKSQKPRGVLTRRAPNKHAQSSEVTCPRRRPSFLGEFAGSRLGACRDPLMCVCRELARPLQSLTRPAMPL